MVPSISALPMPPPTSGSVLDRSEEVECGGVYVPRAILWSPDLEENTGGVSRCSRCMSGMRIPRKPDSSATEKQELSALNEADRAKGPLSESSTGRVFMLPYRMCVVFCGVSGAGRRTVKATTDEGTACRTAQ